MYTSFNRVHNLFKFVQHFSTKQNAEKKQHSELWHVIPHKRSQLHGFFFQND